MGESTVEGSGREAVRAPAWMLPSQQEQMQGAMSAFRGGPESYVQGAARNLAGQTLRGDFLTPGTNPFLAQQIDQLGNQIQNQTQTRFAGSGRNVGGPGAQRQFADTLAQVSVPLSAQNYAMERQLQQGTMGQASQFDPLNQYMERMSLLADSAGQDRSWQSTEASNPSFLDTLLGVFG